jgi:hypothetical protein
MPFSMCITFFVALVVLEDEASHTPLVVDPRVEGSGIESLEINT